MSLVKIYNTPSRKIEEFKPIKAGEVSIYSCGPTVYHYPHVGNLRAFIFADLLRRMFIMAHYKVKHVINITDVGHLVGDEDDGQDKLEKGAMREGKNVWEIAKTYTDSFLEDLEALNIETSEYIFPRATDNIREQIALIRVLEIEGYTYKTSDGIYFDTSKFPRYADFAKLNLEGQKSGARVTENKEKRNTTDFALWKFSPKDEQRQMEWDSPWGKGFPGWHIECSAMSMKYLGNTFDIHTGGIDHISVHHTNEIAQSEAVTGEKYVNYWMHVNFLQDASGKMSKSSGDFLRLSTLTEKGYSPLAFRYYILTTHYRKEINFSYEALDAATVAYKKLYKFCADNSETKGEINEEYKKKFKELLFNDLGTPECVALIWDLIKDNSVSNADKHATIIRFDRALGLDLKKIKKEKVVLTEEVENLLEKRKVARENKNWLESDSFRDEIEKLGFIVKDGKDGEEITLK
jgi:cysteinyl-tRNA synthetase